MTGTWREREVTPRALAMSASGRSLVPTIVVKFLAVAMTALMTLSAGVAYAAWIASGTGMSSARAATAGAGNAPTSAVSGRTVSLSWSASTYSNGIAVPSYLVKRYNAAGTIVQTIASGTCAALVSGTTCSHTAAPSGSWKYTVTPAVGSWRGAESAQVSVTVGAPTADADADAHPGHRDADRHRRELPRRRVPDLPAGQRDERHRPGRHRRRRRDPHRSSLGRRRRGHGRAARRYDGRRAHGLRRRFAQRRERRPGHHRRQHAAARSRRSRAAPPVPSPRRRRPSPSPTPSHP